jgi:hypothetical protein
MSALEKKSAEIALEMAGKSENYGFIITVAYILIIIVNSIRLYRLCKDKDEQLFDGIKNLGIAQKLVLSRQIKKNIPELDKDGRKKLLNVIVDKAKTIEWDEFISLLAEIKKVT